MKGQKKIFHENGNQKRAAVVVLVSDNVVFKTQVVTGDEEGHYILIKASIHQEDITITNIIHT